MSDINPNVIVDNEPVSKADLREQLQIAADEITALQLQVSLPRRMMIDDTLWTSL